MLTPVIQRFSSVVQPWALFRRIYDRFPVCLFLDSVHYRRPDQVYSYIIFDPFQEVVLEARRKNRPPNLRLSGASQGNFPAELLGQKLEGLLKKYAVKRNPRAPFFRGGAAGFLGYEMAALFENVRFRKKKPAAPPLLYFGFFRKVIIYDHAKKIYHLSVQAENRSKASSALRELKALFALPEKTERKSFSLTGFRPDISRKKFEKMVRAARRYIQAGDIYQANLSQRFSFKWKGSALDLYGRLRKINPSPFAVFAKVHDLEIVSSSPERLVARRGDLCETRPIAGTRPRRKGSSQKVERELLASPKERAEHVMLVDLERNDLGRICRWNSVKVDELMTLEKYSHVIHIVSKITGRLQKGAGPMDILKAMFPGGTITGCPKVRCMEIIDELEPFARGLYTGSVGYIDFGGDMDFNIIIRTLVLHQGRGYLQTGAGIVYDSDPAREFEETLHKGEALTEALFPEAKHILAGGRARKKART